MLDPENNLKVKYHINSLSLDIAILRDDLEEIIQTSYDKEKLLKIQSEMNQKQYYLKQIKLNNFHKLPYPL